MEHLTEPTLWAFLLQAVAFVAYIPTSYLEARAGEAIIVTIGDCPDTGIGRNNGW